MHIYDRGFADHIQRKANLVHNTVMRANEMFLHCDEDMSTFASIYLVGSLH